MRPLLRIYYTFLQQQSVIRTFFAQGKALQKGNGKGMRYEAVFLLEALMLNMKSNAAYRHLRKKRILPLPSASTIRKLISSSDCHFGFNELALDNIASALKQFGPGDPFRYGCLMWDEITIKKSIKFDNRRLEWDGVVNYGSDFPDLPCDALADHALVLVFRPYKLSWIQLIASFATKGAAPGDVLHRIVMKAVTSLYFKGAIVKNVVCDGNQCNKSVFKLLGVTSKDLKQVKPYFIYPMDPTIKICCFFTFRICLSALETTF